MTARAIALDGRFDVIGKHRGLTRVYVYVAGFETGTILVAAGWDVEAEVFRRAFVGECSKLVAALGEEP